MTTLILATRNTHKLQEIKAILGNAFRLLSLKEFPEAPAVAEDQPTLAQNAAKKARSLAKWLTYLPNAEYRLPGASASVLADDSGLEVDALNGAPGVHSARFAALDTEGPSSTTQNSSDADNNAKLLRLLECQPQVKRSARFRCVLSLIAVKPPQASLAGHLFEGVCEGRIALEPSGQGGFGYDPLFIPSGYQQSFAELGPEVKNQMSHRAQALMRMRKALENLALGDEMPSF
jgi:XTP/dITP diphosphohydrolase